ncbi:unnamed protein product, partial [Linum tenue]
EAWERVWGRLDEDRTHGEVLRKSHGHTHNPHGRASDQFGRVGLCESKHGQSRKPARPCEDVCWPCGILRGQTR